MKITLNLFSVWEKEKYSIYVTQNLENLNWDKVQEILEHIHEIM